MNTGMQVKFYRSVQLFGFGCLGFLFPFVYFDRHIHLYQRHEAKPEQLFLFFLSQKMLMLPHTTLEMKAPSLLCAAAQSRIQSDNLYHISHAPANGLQLFTFQKESVTQYVSFFFYRRIL